MFDTHMMIHFRAKIQFLAKKVVFSRPKTHHLESLGLLDPTPYSGLSPKKYNLFTPSLTKDKIAKESWRSLQSRRRKLSRQRTRAPPFHSVEGSLCEVLRGFKFILDECVVFIAETATVRLYQASSPHHSWFSELLELTPSF